MQTKHLSFETSKIRCVKLGPTNMILQHLYRLQIQGENRLVIHLEWVYHAWYVTFTGIQGTPIYTFIKALLHNAIFKQSKVCLPIDQPHHPPPYMWITQHSQKVKQSRESSYNQKVYIILVSYI